MKGTTPAAHANGYQSSPYRNFFSPRVSFNHHPKPSHVVCIVSELVRAKCLRCPVTGRKVSTINQIFLSLSSSPVRRSQPNFSFERIGASLHQVKVRIKFRADWERIEKGLEQTRRRWYKDGHLMEGPMLLKMA